MHVGLNEIVHVCRRGPQCAFAEERVLEADLDLVHHLRDCLCCPLTGRIDPTEADRKHGFFWIEIHFLEAECSGQPRLVESERLPVDVPSLRTTMTVWAQRNQVLKAMLGALRPRHDMVNIDIDVSARVNRTAVASFKEDLPPEVSWNR